MGKGLGRGCGVSSMPSHPTSTSSHSHSPLPSSQPSSPHLSLSITKCCIKCYVPSPNSAHSTAQLVMCVRCSAWLAAYHPPYRLYHTRTMGLSLGLCYLPACMHIHGEICGVCVCVCVAYDIPLLCEDIHTIRELIHVVVWWVRWHLIDTH